jgi:hypothetical protein
VGERVEPPKKEHNNNNNNIWREEIHHARQVEGGWHAKETRPRPKEQRICLLYTLLL